MADIRRLAELGMVPPLAKEVAAQITSGVGDKRRLAELSMVTRLASEVATQITTKVTSVRRLAELSMPPVLANELVTQIQGGGGYGPQPIRLVASGGQVNTASVTTTGTKTRCKGRKRYRVSTKANARRVRLGFSNWHMANALSTAAEVNGATDVVLDQVYLEYNGQSVRVTKDGSNTITVPAGQDLLFSDDVLPAAFGLSQFPAGAQIFARWSYTQTAGNACSGYGSNQLATGDIRVQYDATANPGFDDVSGTGAMSSPAGANQVAMFGPIGLFGEFDQPAVALLHIGDSLLDNSNDISGDGEAGGEWGRRAAWSAGIPAFNMALAGHRLGYYNGVTTKKAVLYQYFTHGVCELGTNDIAGGINNGTMLVNARAIWAALKAAGVQKVYQTNILPKVTSTDGCTTLGNQTVFSAQFDTGGYRDLFHAALPAEVTAGRIDGVMDVMSVVADPTNNHFFKQTGFETTLAAASLSGATTISTTAQVPDNGHVVVIDAGVVDSATTNVLPGQTTGTGPFSVKLSAGLNSAHASGVTVRTSYSKDGTHLGAQGHIEVANSVLPLYQTFAAA